MIMATEAIRQRRLHLHGVRVTGYLVLSISWSSVDILNIAATVKYQQCHITGERRSFKTHIFMIQAMISNGVTLGGSPTKIDVLF